MLKIDELAFTVRIGTGNAYLQLCCKAKLSISRSVFSLVVVRGRMHTSSKTVIHITGVRT